MSLSPGSHQGLMLAQRIEDFQGGCIVKKLTIFGLAVTLSCATSSVWGQYPGAYGSLGPSSYPVQQQAFSGLPQVPQPYSTQAYAAPTQPHPGMQGGQPGWMGQRNAPFHLIGTQDQNQVQNLPAPQVNPVPQQYGQSILAPSTPVPDPIASAPAYNNHVQQSVPMGHANVPQAMTYQSAPAQDHQMNPVYGQTVAPGCTSCGNAPLTESYAIPSYSDGGYSGGCGVQSCGPQGYGMGYAAPACGASGCGVSGCGPMGFGGRAGFGQSLFGGLPCGAKPYFGGFNALIFRRIDNPDYQLTYNVNAPDGNFLGTRDAAFGTMGGIDGFVGRYFNCGRNAFTLGYWGLFPDDESAMVTTAGGADLRSRYHFNGLNMPAIGIYAPDSVYNWYDDAVEHRILRTSDYHNVEANLLGFMTGGAARNFYLPTSCSMFSGMRGYGRGCGYCGGGGCGMCGGGYADYTSCGGGCGSACGTNYCADNCATSCAPQRFATGPCCLTPGCGSRLNMTWLAGVRYFRFRDTFSYAASRLDTAFTGANDDIYWDTGVTNDLVGFQIGGILNICAGRRASGYMLTKMGLYGNHAQYDASIGGRAVRSIISSNNLYNGSNWMVSSSKTDVAFLGELGSGVNYRLTSKWSANVGYRAVVVSGVATAVDQIPLQLVHLGNVADFDNNGVLVLHGVNLGGCYNY